MASRLLPRRSFATPFVLTLAAVPACVAADAPPPKAATQYSVAEPTTPPPQNQQNQPQQQEPKQPAVLIMENPPRPQPQPEPVKPAPTPTWNPPPPTQPGQTNPTKPGTPGPLDGGTKTAPTPPTTDRHWVVARTGTSCKASDTDACRGKPAPRNGTVPTCTTPMADYKCPDGLADGATLNIIQYAGKATCNVVMPAVVCPAKPATCNPPPPRQIACP
ncbi:MAG: hypothetical protein H0T79_08850 [Deltaproteobacteria bacterium]|nr:hypothetical protein [Deltaproteobacteria bacterium]